MSNADRKISLPGFGLPIEYVPTTQPLFRNALETWDLSEGSAQLPLTTRREFTMLNLMDEITDKADWHKKVLDPTIAAKWRAEALATTDRDITEKMIDWCIAELQHKARDFEKTWSVSVYNGDVVKSDHAVPAALKEALKAAVAPLEQVPAHEKDWHPGSDGKVLDLVHPSLFPLVYGRSKILPKGRVGLDDCITRSGEGVTIPLPRADSMPPNDDDYDDSLQPYSRRFQWLPCDVEFVDDEGAVKIASYVNNLHPMHHRALYSVLEQLIQCTIPLWNRALTPIARLEEHMLPPPRISYTRCEYDPDPESGPDTEGPQRAQFATEDEWYEARDAWYAATRRVVLPEPGVFEPLVESDADVGRVVDLAKEYNDIGVQVIVKLANIHLTPEKPTYEGGAWHVEGKLVSSLSFVLSRALSHVLQMQNEHICASAIYYYDSENITPSRLAFRQQSDNDTSDIEYAQEHHDWLTAVFGCTQGQPAVQNIGSVETREGRLLVWPNILQHRVEPFALQDATKPGHRKIVALFLVDPEASVISTANVPCQQRAWWREAVLGGVNEGAVFGKKGFAALPLEFKHRVFNSIGDFPISLEEAKQMRLELMEERKKFVVQNSEAFMDHTFSLCEH
ncbi:hypothetical protein H0H81_001104 [Sphagnurus paluster]|uniref:Uncharacterized protein n=1 Tax=Sphagnurus paluster TaxID=117069 RepID=A0A9P7FZS1_9AGAR|nr:hypothetical protein H0H81_001104 [Sphagnurus paluster]